MSSVIMGSRCMTASSSNDEPSQDGLFHRLRGLATARCGHDGPGTKPDWAARWASGGLRPAVLSSPPRPELQYHRRTGPRGRGVDPDRRRPKVSDESQAVGSDARPPERRLLARTHGQRHGARHQTERDRTAKVEPYER